MAFVNSILIVDDEPAVRDVMARWLSDAGVVVRTAGSADEALAAVNEAQCDLAVIDVRMPGQDGVWLKNELRRTHPETAVVLATAYTDIFTRGDATIDIADVLVKPFARDRFLLAVDRGRQWRKRAVEDLRWHGQLFVEIKDRTAEIAAALREATAAGEPEIEALGRLVEMRSPGVMAHGERIRGLAVATAVELGVEPQFLPLLDLTAFVHDVGKAAMPEPLLTKPSAHTPSEQTMMRRHVEIGAELLAGTRTLSETAPLVLATHEWFGGGGYPLNLAGGEIPIASRIIAVVDAYDAMTHQDGYRPPLASADAVSELLRCAHTQFDPMVVVAYLAVQGRH